MLEKNAPFKRFKDGAVKIEGEVASFEVDNEVWNRLSREITLTGDSIDDVIVRLISGIPKVS